MKIVINRCYGGFGLSEAAVDLYLKKQGKQCFRYKQTKYEFKDGEDLYEKTTALDEELCLFHFTKDFGDSFTEWPEEKYFYAHDLPRDDKILIETIEEIGSAISSGRFARLEIIEIPDGIEYTIEEYDGQEWVAEKHRTW